MKYQLLNLAAIVIIWLLAACSSPKAEGNGPLALTISKLGWCENPYYISRTGKCMELKVLIKNTSSDTVRYYFWEGCEESMFITDGDVELIPAIKTNHSFLSRITLAAGDSTNCNLHVAFIHKFSLFKKFRLGLQLRKPSPYDILSKKERIKEIFTDYQEYPKLKPYATAWSKELNLVRYL